VNATSLKAVLVIATTAGVPGASQVARVLTGEPRVVETEIGGVPATVAAPGPLTVRRKWPTGGGP
jgi:hypothetical protein